MLTHAVALQAPAGLPADRLALLGGVVDHADIPLLCQTSYALLEASGSVELLEDGAVFALVPSVDDAVQNLDHRIRLRVLDLAARSGWLPLDAGLAVVDDRSWLVVGGQAQDRAGLLAELIADGAAPGTAEVTLVRSGSAVGYPRPVWLRGPEGDVVAVDAGGRAAIRPRPLAGIVLLADDPTTGGSQAVTGALLAARLDAGIRRPAADVAEIAGLVRRTSEVLVAGLSPDTWAGLRSRLRFG
jgi:hypothetical protein